MSSDETESGMPSGENGTSPTSAGDAATPSELGNREAPKMSNAATVDVATDDPNRPRIKIARALWDYAAIEDNEISFRAGDVIDVLELCNDDWYEGRINGTVGYFPANRIEILPEEDAKPPLKSKSSQPQIDASSLLANMTAETFTLESPKPQVQETPAEEAKQGEEEEEDPFADDKDADEEEDEAGPEDEENVDHSTEHSTTKNLDGEDDNDDDIVLVDIPKHEKDDGEAELKHQEPIVGANHINGWKPVTDNEGRVYYWHEESDRTSWDIPTGAHEGSHSLSTTLADLDVSQFDVIPPELIRKEGPLKKKSKKDDGSKESRLTSTWKSGYGIVCPGFFVLFKDAPNPKAKKTLVPSDIIPLENILVEGAGKDQTSKKNAFMINESNGKQWLFVPDSESSGWVDVIRDACKEKLTPVEYEDAVNRIFSKPKSEVPVPQKREEKQRSRRPTSAALKDKDAPIQSVGEEKSKNQVRAKIGAFFAKKISASKAKDKESVSEVGTQDLVFGGSLDLQIDKEGRKVPLVVEMCCAEVERRGLLSQGIYRLSGTTASIQKFKLAFNQNEPVSLDSEDLDINVVASLLKLYFRELQNPLIPFEFYEQFISSAKIEDYNDRLITMKTLVQSLPPSNYDVLEFLIRHLCKVAEQSEVNKMERSNLAIVFAPTLIRIPEDGGQLGYLSMVNMPFHNTLIESMLEQCDWLFNGSED
ncbi:Rho GTPase-activating protein 27 [Blyttiomyces sp. JEL0837]|nr:Rho GTPase-activating protein 27 [Blyttiomyces sp. JEL0837]